MPKISKEEVVLKGGAKGLKPTKTSVKKKTLLTSLQGKLEGRCLFFGTKSKAEKEYESARENLFLDLYMDEKDEVQTKANF
jgi:hypothetical protein